MWFVDIQRQHQLEALIIENPFDYWKARSIILLNSNWTWKPSKQSQRSFRTTIGRPLVLLNKNDETPNIGVYIWNIWNLFGTVQWQVSFFEQIENIEPA